jgi:hypothetical protein
MMCKVSGVGYLSDTRCQVSGISRFYVSRTRYIGLIGLIRSIGSV